MKLSKQLQDFIKAQGVARLATVGGDGAPHNVPVCPVWVDGMVYVGSEKGGKKVKNLQANSLAAITFDVYRDSWKGLRGVMLQCTGHIVDDKLFKKIRRKVYAKYPRYEKDAALEPEDSVIIEFLPHNQFSWGFE